VDPITLINFSAALIKAGVATYAQIKETIQANKGELTNEQLDAILDAIASDDDERATKAERIAEGIDTQ
jgi:hypothetical protein